MTTWRDQYRPGSFRGVPFVTRAHDAQIGRRGETNEFPERDVPYREDLGRAARRWSVHAFVIGDNYMAARDALIDAIEAPGPGTLVHPYLGTFSASVLDCTFSESSAEGGMALFDIQFGEPGVAIVAAVSPDGQAKSIANAAAVSVAAQDRFDEDFEADGQPPHVQSAAVALATSFALDAVAAGNLLGGAGGALRTFYDGIASIQGAALLITQPARLALNVAGIVAALAALAGNPGAQVRALLGLINSQARAPIIAATTPSRTIQARNQQAFADLVIATSAAAIATVTAGTSFDAYDDAVSFRDQICDALDVQAILAADRGNDALSADLDAVRRSIIVDVTARGGSLARLFTFTPAAVTPALVLAWRLYRDPSSTIDQAAEIVSRNRVRHPGFIPATTLSVLTAEPDDG